MSFILSKFQQKNCGRLVVWGPQPTIASVELPFSEHKSLGMRSETASGSVPTLAPATAMSDPEMAV